MTAITRYRGDTTPITGNAFIDGVALDITGCTFVLTVDPSKAPLDAAANLFSTTGSIVDALTGEIEFPLTDEQADQTPGTYYFDIQLTDGAAKKRTITLDKYIVKQDISKG